MTSSDESTTGPLALGVLLVLFLLLAIPLLMMATMMLTGGFHGGMSTTGMAVAPVWGLVMLLVFVLVLVGIGYGLYRSTVDQRPGQDPALRELRLAYARGDLSDEEFEKRRETLDETE